MATELESWELRPELLHPDEPVESDPAYRQFVSYIDKSRDYYLAQGYGNPYRWATHQDAPFTPLRKPLAECRVGLVTTATLREDEPDAELEAAAQRQVYVAPTDPPPERLQTWRRSWDKEATHTEDLDSFFPVHRLREFATEGRIGSLSPRFYGLPTQYSQRMTRDHDAPAILHLMREDGVDAAVLVPL